MISVLGNIKIDESRPERVQYLFASLLSLNGFSDDIHVSLEQPSSELFRLINKYYIDKIYVYSATNFYDMQIRLINQVKNDYYLNFEEDHFLVLENVAYLNSIIETARQYNVAIIRGSFNEVEQRSSEDVDCFYEDELCKIFRMDNGNFKKFQKHYTRYYIGTNCIFHKGFARMLYDKPLSRPHDYEVVKYNPNFEHFCMIPKFPILASIDDPHGEEGSNLLSNPTEKFLSCMSKAEKYAKSSSINHSI